MEQRMRRKYRRSKRSYEGIRGELMKDYELVTGHVSTDEGRRRTYRMDVEIDEREGDGRRRAEIPRDSGSRDGGMHRSSMCPLPFPQNSLFLLASHVRDICRYCT